METRREDALMETAMRIMHVFDVMIDTGIIDSRKTCMYGEFELLGLFIEWTREFEDRYIGSEEYEDHFMKLSGEFAYGKIKEKFGKA